MYTTGGLGPPSGKPLVKLFPVTVGVPWFLLTGPLRDLPQTLPPGLTISHTLDTNPSQEAFSLGIP